MLDEDERRKLEEELATRRKEDRKLQQELQRAKASIELGNLLTLAELQSNKHSLFDNLPFFCPWFWKMLAVVGSIAFIAGGGLAIYVYFSLIELMNK